MISKTQHLKKTLFIRIVLLTFSLILLINCSFQPPSSDWKIKSKNAFNSYTKNFLSSKDLLAKNDLSRAINHANVSADLSKLARLYLSTCALNISVGLDDLCADFLNIRGLIKREDLNAYYNFIQKNHLLHNISLLPKSYQQFAQNINQKNFNAAIKILFEMKRASSKFIAAAIIKEELTSDDRKKIIDIASFYGYKKLVIFWLKESIKHTPNLDEKMLIKQKVTILESTD